MAPPNPAAAVKPIVIAVMGVTGTGKSTFIQKVTGIDTGVSDRIKSATTVAHVYKSLIDGKEVWFMDTPGFNASDQTDTKVLQSISQELAAMYKDDKLKVNGVVYLHPIYEKRMGLRDIQTLRMFEKLVGLSCLKNVVLATTMWDALKTKDEGIRREAELKAEHWDFLSQYGMSVRRIEDPDDLNSYLSIVRDLMNNIAVTLQIQEEVVDKCLPLDKTSAGKEVLADIIKATEEVKQQLADLGEELRRTKEKSDAESKQMREILEAEKRELNEQLRVAADDRTALQKTLVDLRSQSESSQRNLASQLENMRITAANEKQQLNTALEDLKRQKVSPPPPPQPNPNPLYKHDYSAEYSQLVDLASSQFQAGQMQNAMQYFYQALSIAIAHFGDNHPHTLETRRNIDVVRHYIGTNIDRGRR
jgi:hypothetical protein